MATRNLFRFVSVRPPDAVAVEDACRLVNAAAAARFVDEVRAWQHAHNETLHAACRAVSISLIESHVYFAGNDTWEGLRPLLPQFQDFVARLCRTKSEPETTEDGRRQRRGRAREADEVPPPRQVESALDNPDAFGLAKHTLWLSYYANVLAPELRPNDRPEMLDWIRVLAALERLRPSQDGEEWRYDGAICDCVARLNSGRVNMPHELFAETPPPDPAPDDPKDPTDDEILVLRASLERLHAARRRLDQLYRYKVGRLRLESPEREPDDVENGRGAADGGAATAAGSEAVRPLRPLWLLTDDDAEAVPDVAEELGRLGLPLAGSIVPEAAEALDEAITARTAELAALESTVDILGVGPTMAVARRTRRGLKPPSNDAADGKESAT
jgi:hypothetical protein